MKNHAPTKFDMLEYATGESLSGKEFKLDWSRAPDGHAAQVEWIEIEYQEYQGKYHGSNISEVGEVPENFKSHAWGRPPRRPLRFNFVFRIFLVDQSL